MVSDKIRTIKKLSTDIPLLYVEDNIGLCNNMKKLLERVNDNVIIANDGEEGYKKFLEHEPKIIITDINMPKMNGFKMIKKIQAIEPECKTLILSAHDEKEHLHAAINLEVFRYLNKPTKIPELIDAIYDTVLSIHKEENRRLFLNQLQNIFNYQNNIVVMMFEGNFILPNQRFLEFFGVDTLDEFNEKFDMEKLLLEHKEFLYSSDSGTWYEQAIKNSGTLFHTKIENHEGIKRHLILKSRDVPEKKGHYILSLDDVTELNLMALFDSESTNNDNMAQDKMAVITFMQIVRNNSAEVKIHNFYKGLTIVNPAVLVKITDDEIVLKTVNSQLKILQLTKFTTISSEIFPQSVVCKSIYNIDNDNQTITIKDMQFSQRTATDRKFIRLEPGEKQSCSLFYKEIKFTTETTIIDISEVSAKVEIKALPAGMAIDEKVNLSINFKINNRQTSLSTEATVYRIDENKRSYYLVILFEVCAKDKKLIGEYIANRQMELIREFKKLNITQ
ncbi:signal transduction response regulator receiver (CheY-like) [Sulfurimonas gotlandica GD1]|uniref:Signal transduction response regulator receiver (CheY-like) n=1 Tax=Sulfurimonas gotlandica (strain DSM 19862 / JCM 16533 / GD1) TaxID=929558 RepID=B6BN80_SULGG|nr:response regulator [Sulfurimonas gotlandica]EDZ61413.1 response regulator receiver domain protein [Sulfurimonas gotlandica GD1]EHP30948.1 signal transduction response regulator receiver (CheY-like) [Sulfurimonas gotlandica GD1]